MEKDQVKLIKPLVLAFVGDAVHTLYVRKHFSLIGDYTTAKLNRMVKEKVNAGCQCRVFRAIEDSLTDDERDIARHARNSVKGQGAKNYSVYEYNYATAFEALVGYLYLSGEQKRLDEILKRSVEIC